MLQGNDIFALTIIVYVYAIVFTECLCDENDYGRYGRSIMEELEDDIERAASVVHNVETRSPGIYDMEDMEYMERNFKARASVQGNERRKRETFCEPGCAECRPGAHACQTHNDCCSLHCKTKDSWYWYFDNGICTYDYPIQPPNCCRPGDYTGGKPVGDSQYYPPHGGPSHKPH